MPAFSSNAPAVKSHCDFVALASRYTRLRRARKQYVGLCPFHSERHPSFYVHPDRKIFYCFGCGAGGDVFDFIMRIESCDFPRAVEIAVEFSTGVAAGRELRSSERLASGVGAKPLPAKRAVPYSPENRTREAEWRAWQRAALSELNARAAGELASACEPARSAPLLETEG